MLQHVYPSKLKNEMKTCIDLNKPIRKNVKIFIARQYVEAASCQSCAKNRQLKTPKPKQDGSGLYSDGRNENTLCFWKPHHDRAIKKRKAKLYEELRKYKKEKHRIKGMKIHTAIPKHQMALLQLGYPLAQRLVAKSIKLCVSIFVQM